MSASRGDRKRPATAGLDASEALWERLRADALRLPEAERAEVADALGALIDGILTYDPEIEPGGGPNTLTRDRLDNLAAALRSPRSAR
jgi:hypothetical protein